MEPIEQFGMFETLTPMLFDRARNNFLRVKVFGKGAAYAQNSHPKKTPMGAGAPPCLIKVWPHHRVGDERLVAGTKGNRNCRNRPLGNIAALVPAGAAPPSRGTVNRFRTETPWVPSLHRP